jgi:predicted nucleotidyltransferase
MQMNNFGLPQDVFDEIRKVLNRFPDVKRVKIFGSRAKGIHKRYSDVDIAIFAEADHNLAANIKYELDNLDVVYNFDVLHYEMTLNDEIKAHIDRVGVEIYERGMTAQRQ